MTFSLQPSLSPRNGKTLKVLVIARISGDKQDVRSLDDQIALAKTFLEKNYEGPFNITSISGVGSGERLDRKEVQEASDAVETREYDLVLMEDLGRAFRRVHAVLFCEQCQDCETRLIAINDSIDTGKDNWQIMTSFASMRHEMYNRDTSLRIRRSLTNRFQEGGTLQFVIFGYVKPPGAIKDTELQIMPEAREIYDEIFTKLENGSSYSEVADWLNGRGTPTGKYSRHKGKWTCGLVSRTVNNPILMGIRVRNNRVAYRDNKSGRRKTRKAKPDERIERACPHLAIIEPERWLRVTALMRQRNAKWKRVKNPGEADPRAGIPFKRTTWPGQHARCGVCGNKMFWGGHGRKEDLVCSGAKDYRCWNVVTCDGKLAARRVVEALLREIESLPDFDRAFRERVRSAAIARRSDKTERLKALERELGERARKIERLLDMIESNADSKALSERLTSLEAEKATLELERAKLRAEPDDVPELPSLDTLKEQAREKIGQLDLADPVVGRLLSQLCPSVEFLPFELFQSGSRDLRAYVTMNLAPLFAPTHASALGDVFVRKVVVDAFDPPKHVRYRHEVFTLHGVKMRLRDIAKNVRISFGSVQNTLEFQRQLEKAGLKDPYFLLTDAPAGKKGRYCRHIHERYRYTPLPGYPKWPAAQVA